MSLRLRLFLLLSALVAGLVVAQVGWVRALTRELSAEVGSVALSVGGSLLSTVGEGGVVLREEHVTVDEGGEVQRKVRIRHLEGGGEAAVQAVPGLEAPTELGAEPGAVTGPEPVSEPGTVQTYVYRYEMRHDAPGEGGEGEPATAGDPPSRVPLSLHLGGSAPHRALVVTSDGEERTIPIPEGGLDRRLDAFQRRLLLGSLGLLAVGLAGAGLLAHRVSAPLAALTAAARRVAGGELGAQAPEPRGREVGEAVAAFNRMSGELARLEEEGRRLRARQHLAELGEVSRGLAHTLRNPLNALGLAVDELAARAAGDQRGGGENGADGELADTARRQIRRLDRTVRSLLVLAAEGGGETVPVAVDALAQDVALEALQDGHRVSVEMPDEPVTAIGVAAELRAVIQALVVNAVEASPPGEGVEVKVAPLAGGGASVEVADRGPGLPPAVRERLFTPHQTTKPEGAGMGLFLAHRIAIDRYGGDLRLDDRPGGGTRAVLTLAGRDEAPAGRREAGGA